MRRLSWRLSHYRLGWCVRRGGHAAMSAIEFSSEVKPIKLWGNNYHHYMLIDVEASVYYDTMDDLHKLQLYLNHWSLVFVYLFLNQGLQQNSTTYDSLWHKLQHIWKYLTKRGCTGKLWDNLSHLAIRLYVFILIPLFKLGLKVHKDLHEHHVKTI